MKTITPTVSGLASSLFLNIGLTQVAEKFDLIGRHQVQNPGALSAQYCTVTPCHFKPRQSR